MRDKDGLHTTRQFYDQLDDLGRQEMRTYISRKLEVYLTCFVVIGIATLFLLMVYFRYNDLGQLAIAVLGTNLTGIFWRRYWYHRAILNYMWEFERSR